MRSFQIPAGALSILALLGLSRPSRATPFPLEYDSVLLINRGCTNPCGYNGWLCCASSQTCSTNSDGQAVCLDGGGQSGQWEIFTTTFVQTETDVTTITSTYSSFVSKPTGNSGSCKPTLGETPCGDVCCSASQMCENKVCVDGASSAYFSSFFAPTATATPPLRPTSSGIETVTQTGGPTTTMGFIAPVGTNGASLIGVKASSGGGLSGGAIAGIVIGVLAGVALLLFLWLCCCARGALDGLVACCFGRRRRRETTYVEERYSHHAHGSNTAAAAQGRTWFGTRPSRTEERPKKDSGLGMLATIGLFLGALALCLGLRRRRNRDDEKSEYTYSSSYYPYYSSDYYTSASSESSDRRTRRTSNTRATRTTRTSRSSRRSRSRAQG
ncbi:hypothetical protein VTN02DRAFT_579 [Thermoascus thermophilus]